MVTAPPPDGDRTPHPRTDDGGYGGDDRGQAFTLEGFIASIVVLTAVLFALQAVIITPTTGGAVDQEVRQDLRVQSNDVLAVNAQLPGGTLSDTNITSNRSNAIAELGNASLTTMVLFWNGTANESTWAYAREARIGYGSDQPGKINDSLYIPLGEMLNESFKKRGRVYNLVVEYRKANATNESRSIPIVFRGIPSDDAVSTTFTVPLYDNMTLTGPYDGPINTTNASNPDTYNPPDCNDVPIEAISPNASISENATDANPYFRNSGSGSKPNYDVDEDCFFPIPDAYRPGYQRNDSELYNVLEVRVTVW